MEFAGALYPLYEPGLELSYLVLGVCESAKEVIVVLNVEVLFPLFSSFKEPVELMVHSQYTVFPTRLEGTLHLKYTRFVLPLGMTTLLQVSVAMTTFCEPLK